VPIINVQFLEGRTREHKGVLIERLANVLVETLDVPEDAIRIILTEVSPDDWGVGGRSMAALRREQRGGATP
jgi:4-oxalocrotonate tautomerase